MSRSHGYNHTGRRHYSKDIGDNAPDYDGKQSSWYGYYRNDDSATHYGKHSSGYEYENSGCDASNFPDTCTGSNNSRAAPIADSLADGDGSNV